MPAKARSAPSEDPHLTSPERKACWCWNNRVKAVSKCTPQSHENPSQVSNLICKLQESHATAGLYLLLPPLCFHHFTAASAFRRQGEYGWCLWTRCSSVQPPAFSSASQTCSPRASVSEARQVIIANKKPILRRTGSCSSKAEYHYSMNDSIIYSRAITCSDEAMLIG